MTADRPATEPRTEAGRAIVKEWMENGGYILNSTVGLFPNRIAAIEAEAAQGAAPPNHVVVERLDRPGNRANLEGPTDEERLAFKRSEREAAAAIMAGDRFCPNPSAHEGAAPRAEGLLSVEALAEAIGIVTGIGVQQTEHGIEYDLDGARRILGLALSGTPSEHDLNCGIDALRLGQDGDDIGCTCGVERNA